MCIRDRNKRQEKHQRRSASEQRERDHQEAKRRMHPWSKERCLLYTSDAADERSSVDLGGRRIIKKKKINNTERM